MKNRKKENNLVFQQFGRNDNDGVHERELDEHIAREDILPQWLGAGAVDDGGIAETDGGAQEEDGS